MCLFAMPNMNDGFLSMALILKLKESCFVYSYRYVPNEVVELTTENYINIENKGLGNVSCVT